MSFSSITGSAGAIAAYFAAPDAQDAWSRAVSWFARYLA